MDRTTVLQEIRKMRFEETWNEWKKGRLARKKRDGFCRRANGHFADMSVGWKSGATEGFWTNG